MIFNMKMNALLAGLALSFGITSAAVAACVGNCEALNPLSLDVSGSAAIGGNVGSIFQGSGTNEAYKYGETRAVVESSLGGFCLDGDCTDTSLNIDLMAREGGNAHTSASGASGDDVAAQNSGIFMSGVQAGIDFGGTTTNVSTEGAATFANHGAVNAVGDNVNSNIYTYGSGQTTSTLGTDGTACATCADFTGGTMTKATAGMYLESVVSGGTSGQHIQIQNSGVSEVATSLSNMFDQTSQ
jgi:hypothetical protein